MPNRAFLLVALAACGTIHPTSDVDASLPEPDAAEIDAMPDAAEPDAPMGLPDWGAPTSITELDDPTTPDQDATMTADQLVIIFKSTRTGGMGAGDLWISRRTSATATWPAPAVITELNSTGDEAHPWISPDGLRIYFSSTRPGAGGADIYTSVRATRTSPWSAPSAVTELNTASSEYGVNLTPDGLQGVLDSNRSGTRQPYLITRASTNTSFTSINAIPAIPVGNSGLFADGARSLYYSDGTDLWTSTRPDFATAFGAPTKSLSIVGGLISDPWISDDQRTAMITLATNAVSHIYVVTR